MVALPAAVMFADVPPPVTAEYDEPSVDCSIATASVGVVPVIAETWMWQTTSAACPAGAIGPELVPAEAAVPVRTTSPMTCLRPMVLLGQDRPPGPRGPVGLSRWD